MKFTNGMWLDKGQYNIETPKEIYDIKISEEAVTLYCPYVGVNHRGNTLDGGLLTVVITSPLRNVFSIKLINHMGERRKKAEFELNRGKEKLSVIQDEENYFVKNGDFSIVISKEKTCKMDFVYQDKVITSSTGKGMAHIVDAENGKEYMRESLSLDLDEQIYGLGERFGPFVKNGQSIDIWNEDGGTDSEQSYINIPFYLSSKGYGVFVNDTGRVSFEIGSEIVTKNQFSVEGNTLEYFVFAGDSLKEVINQYTDITGKPPLLPEWSFGLWLSTSFTTDYNEETVLSFIDGMLERDIPLSVFHFDCFWMKEYEWCSFLWNRELFPDPKGLLEKIHDRGMKVCVWINPYIAQKSPLFEEGMKNNYFVNTGDGDVWQWDRWQAGMALVDFTNEDAVGWYQEKLAALIDMGVDCFKTDFGERIPVSDDFYGIKAARKGIRWNKDYREESMHNYYSYLYNQAVYELLQRKKGENEACLFARSGTAGSQKYPVHWGGDSLSNYSSMAESLRGGLSLGMCGFAYWSHDISGFEAGSTPDIYKRWTQFGLLSSHSRYHGNQEYKVPWLYGEEAVEVTREFTRLKGKLLPYLLELSKEAHETGLPILRPMVLEFPQDLTCRYLDRQYMLGDKLLVAPIFRQDGEVEYYLPGGKWTHLLSGEVKEGGRWYKETYDYHSLPLYVKENTAIPEGVTV